MNRLRAALALDLAVKAALVGLLLFAVARPDLPQFAGKAIDGRVLTYPIAALIVPWPGGPGGGGAAGPSSSRTRSTCCSSSRS